MVYLSQLREALGGRPRFELGCPSKYTLGPASAVAGYLLLITRHVH